MDAGSEKMEKGEERVEDEVNNEIEQNKVSLMRAFVETQDPTAKEVDDLMIRRFLRARDLDIAKASGMFLKYLKWKRSFVPNGFISESEVANDIAQNKWFLQGFDKSGRPVVVVLGAKHFARKEKGRLDELMRFVVYILDKITARMPRGQEKFICIGDLEGWGYSNSDIRGYLGALSILQDYYPERLGKINTRKKIEFVENKNLKSTLLQDIDESQLPEIYGGKQPLVPIEES